MPDPRRFLGPSTHLFLDLFLGVLLCAAAPRSARAQPLAPAARRPPHATAVPAPAGGLTGNVVVRVTPEASGWRIRAGERPAFVITVTRDGQPISGLRGRWELGLENLPAQERGEFAADAPARVEGAPAPAPGFIACEAQVEVDGRTYKGRAAVGIDPEKIAPTVEIPADFEAFWVKAKQELAAIPLDAVVTPAPERSQPGVDCHHVSVASAAAEATGADGKPRPPSRLYGILCEPQGPGPFPAILQVPGAGVRAYRGDPALARKGVITFQIGIHGLPVNLDAEVYDGLAQGALAGYPSIHAGNPDRYYYRRVYLSTVRANDFLFSRPRFDRKSLGVSGGSQGGALAIVTAALDPRVKALVSFYPALADHTGFLHGRTGGWPFLLRQESARTPDVLRALPYFDVVNFARRVRAPGFYSWGFNDTVCPPTSLYAAYNVIPGPRELWLALETGHFTTPEQRERADAWLLDKLGVRRN